MEAQISQPRHKSRLSLVPFQMSREDSQLSPSLTLQFYVTPLYTEPRYAALLCAIFRLTTISTSRLPLISFASHNRRP